MKRVIVISNFHEDSATFRSYLAFKYFSDKGFEPIALYSTFSHSLKKFRHLDEERFIPLATIGYQSTLSVSRILSYLIFSYKAFRYLRKSKADIVYINLPPNLLALAFLLNPGKRFKVILDIIDLWPESFPHNDNVIKKALLFLTGIIPKQIRKMAVKKCDYRITESELFFRKLHLNDKINSKVIHLKKYQKETPVLSKPSDVFSVVYLGNMGAVIDFDSLFKIMKGVAGYREVRLHIIGLGPRSQWFFENLKKLKISYRYHGASFDEHLKTEVLSSCWFGYNGYKQNVEVALSYKSIDYLSCGVPLLNSVKEDTFRLVATEKIGFNFNQGRLEELIMKLSKITLPEVIEMKKRARKIFQEKFSWPTYCNEMDEVMKNL